MIILRIRQTVFVRWQAALMLGLLLVCAGYAGAATLTVSTTNDSGAGSLRQAILDAAVTPGTNKIHFNIPNPTSSPFTINLQSALPGLTNNVIIDGYTQPGATRNTLSNGNNAVIKIRLSGAAATGTDGLDIRNAGCEVYGLAIVNFPGNGIYLRNSGNAIIQGNLIGLEPDGVNVGANGGLGIRCTAAGAVIGGSAPEQRNVISGNLGGGLSFQNSGGHVVQGNYIGTDTSGTLPRGNTGIALELTNTNSTNNLIGGLVPGAGNIIAGATGTGSNNHGIYIFNASSNRIQGNFIGTDVTGINLLGNLGCGIYMTNATMNNRVGSTNAGAGNVIAHNAAAGVWIASGTNAVQGNSIFANGGLGIDLGTVGVTPNDSDDTDSGANNQQNFPSLTGVTNASGSTTIRGTLQTQASTTYRIEFFASPNRDPSGYGEGQTYLGFTNVTTDASGTATIAASVTTGTLLNQFVSATATDPANNSSEFSLGRLVFLAEPPIITHSPQDALVWRLGETNSLAVVADGSAALSYQWFREGTLLAGQTNRVLWFNGVQPSDLGLYSVIVSNVYGVVGPLSARLLLDPNSGIILADNLNDSGPGSLRQAILDANASAVSPAIYFGYSGSGPFTIRLTSPLPSLMVPMVLDGTTLPGYAGQPLVELDGGGIFGDGLLLKAGQTTVRGLALFNFGGSGLRLETGGANLIEGNFIGLRADGITPLPNGQHGVLVMASVGNQIGGSTPASRNVISGNLGEGIRLDSTGTSNTVIQGNFIGTDATGTQPVGNNGSGIEVADAVNNLVGGTGPGEGNRIAFNGRNGVMVLSGQGEVLGNAIFANAALGIDLGGDGVTPNDPGDTDTGPNDLQNSPEILSATNGPSGTSLSGVLRSTPNTLFRLEFFSGPACGQASLFVGTTQAVSDSSGDAVFSVNFPTGDLTGSLVMATATDPDGHTSELSLCQRVAVPPYIVNQPVDQTLYQGDPVTLSIVAAGTPPLHYQWLRNGLAVAGATNASLTFNSVLASHDGLYTVVITNIDGTVISAPAVLTVLLPTLPVLLTQPLSQTVSAGATVVFNMSYSGVGAFAVQWRLNGVNIPGATNTSLVLNTVQATNSGTYSVVVSTPAGAVDSTNAVLTVLLPALIFRDNFASLARLTTASGTGRASNSLATLQTGEPLHANKPGGKSIWIIWQAPHTGVATITTAGSTFDSLLGIYTGNTLATLVEVGNDDDSGGFHTSAVKFNAVSGTQYKIAVAGFGGASGDVVLNWSLETTVQTLPVIRTQPISQTVVPGASANFTVAATGTGLAYQWFFNGNAIPGAVSTNLTLASVNDTHAGKYFVRVSNAARSVHSRHVHLETASTGSDVSQVRTANKFLEGSSTALKP